MAETTEILLPRLAESVTSVKFGAWLKKEGDRVEAGEPIAEVETDKTTVELEAPATGVLCDVRVAPGTDGLEVGAVLARIAPAAADAAGVPPVETAPSPEDGVQPALGAEAGSSRSEPPGAGAPDPERTGSGAPIETPAAGEASRAARDEAAVPGEPPAARGEAPAARKTSPEAPDEVPAGTPLALRMAAAAGLDLSAVRAAGPDGRIRKADIDRVLAARRGASGEDDAPSAQGVLSGEGAPFGEGPPLSGEGALSGEAGQPFAPAPVGLASPPAPTEAGALREAEPPHHEKPLTAMRRVTATRMQQAKQTVPHFYLRTECRVDAALRFLAAAKRHLPDAPPTLTDLVVRAAACALRTVPEANSAWVDGAVRVYERVDVAVAVNTPHGLVAPVVRGAEGKDLGAIARETRALAARAREGRLAPAEYADGTFTISNLGMYGVESLYAIVNPPQSCILGVGAAIRRPVADGAGVGVGTVMACTLSADHRVIDGAAGAELLDAVKSCLEQPGLMLLRTESPAPADRRGPP